MAGQFVGVTALPLALVILFSLSGRVVCRGNCSALGFGDTFFSHNIAACITCFNLSQESTGATAGVDMDRTQVVLTLLARYCLIYHCLLIVYRGHY